MSKMDRETSSDDGGGSLEDIAYRVISSLLPSNGWTAVHVDKSEKGHPVLVQTPLCGFALYNYYSLDHAALSSQVVGLEANRSVSPVEENCNFVGYLAPGGNIDEWQEFGELILQQLDEIGEDEESN